MEMIKSVGKSVGQEIERLGLSWAFEITKATFEPVRPHLPALLKSCYSLITKHSNL